MQSRSGLGIEAQREAVRRFIAERQGELVAPEYVETESGADNERPKLTAALKRCRVTGATLVVAKLDRLSRNAAFLLTLRDSRVPFVAADVPDANNLTVGILAVLAEHEREMISNRTKAALAAAKARGVRLGGARPGRKHVKHYQRLGVEAAKVAKRAAADAALHDVADDLRALQREGLSLNAMARRLNEQGIRTTSGSGQWTATSVRRAVARLAA